LKQQKNEYDNSGTVVVAVKIKLKTGEGKKEKRGSRKEKVLRA